MQVVVTGAEIVFGRRSVLSRFSAVFPANELSVLVGPSGSGKSSLLAAIAGFQTLQKGTIRYGPSGTTGIDPARVTWVSQTANSLGSRSALDNVMLGPLGDGSTIEEAQTRAYKALEDLRLAPKAHQLVRKLSGGELQRIAFARGIASRKSLLLADEPSASLDSINTTNIVNMLLDIRGRCTIIVATHDRQLMKAATNIVELRPDPA